MRTVYDLIRHRSTLEVICENCDNRRALNHKFLLMNFGGGHPLAALKFVCRCCDKRRFRLRIVPDSLGETKPVKAQWFGGAYDKFLD